MKLIEVGDLFNTKHFGISEVIEIDRENSMFTLNNGTHTIIVSFEELQKAYPVHKCNPVVPKRKFKVGDKIVRKSSPAAKAYRVYQVNEHAYYAKGTQDCAVSIPFSHEIYYELYVPKIEIALEDWPKWLPWAAIDQNGYCNLHLEEPHISDYDAPADNNYWIDDSDVIPTEVPSAFFTYTGNWKDSLTKRPEK